MSLQQIVRTRDFVPELETAIIGKQILKNGKRRTRVKTHRHKGRRPQIPDTRKLAWVKKWSIPRWMQRYYTKGDLVIWLRKFIREGKL